MTLGLLQLRAESVDSHANAELVFNYSLNVIVLKRANKGLDVTRVNASMVKPGIEVGQFVGYLFLANFIEFAKSILDGILRIEESIDDILNVSFGFI